MTEQRAHEHHPPATSVAGPPVRWKLWLLLATGVYPIITVLATVGEPVLLPLPQSARFAILVPVMVAVMVWVVIPLLHRWFGRWLGR